MDINPLEVPRILGMCTKISPKVIERAGNPDMRILQDLRFRLGVHEA